MITPKEFWSRVDVKDKHECWEWQGVVQSQSRPYGYFRTGSDRTKRTRHYAHKHAMKLADPNISQEGMDVRHRCDNKRCCNPHHLIVGTRSENIRDSVQRWTHSSGQPTPAQKCSKVPLEDRPKIILDDRPHAVIAAEYGCTPGRITQIKSANLRAQ